MFVRLLLFACAVVCEEVPGAAGLWARGAPRPCCGALAAARPALSRSRRVHWPQLAGLPGTERGNPLGLLWRKLWFMSELEPDLLYWDY